MKLDDIKRRSNRRSALSLQQLIFLLVFSKVLAGCVVGTNCFFTLTFDLKSIYNTLELGHVTVSQYQKQRGTSL